MKTQTGNILVMFTIGLFALIAISSLALDGGHLLLNKTRLQNIVDAAAMHAAKEVDSGKTHAQARAAAMDLIKVNVSYASNNEIDNAIDLSSTAYNNAQLGQHLWIAFFDKPEDALPSTDPTAPYVRIKVSNLPLTNFLAQIMQFDKKVTAIAQAGPSSSLVECFYDLVPMLVCANDPSNETGELVEPGPIGADGEPGEDIVTELYFGLKVNGLNVMKAGAGTNSIGPGNFQLIRINDNKGGADIRDAMAGDPDDDVPQCFVPPTSDSQGGGIPTEPGNTVGPAAQGLNTRFGKWQGPVDATDHPSDVNTCQGKTINITEVDGEFTFDGGESDAKANAYLFSDYQNDIDNSATSCSKTGLDATDFSGDVPITDGALGRRILTVAVADCTDQTNGADSIPYLGSGCFYLTQEIQQGGQESYVVGEFLKECSGLGIPSGDTDVGSGAHTIVLFHVPGSVDS